jgi:hypothetical protein
MPGEDVRATLIVTLESTQVKKKLTVTQAQFSVVR